MRIESIVPLGEDGENGKPAPAASATFGEMPSLRGAQNHRDVRHTNPTRQ
jgi:hypothetical protein